MPANAAATLAKLIAAAFRGMARDLAAKVRLADVREGRVPDLRPWADSLAQEAARALLPSYQQGMVRVGRGLAEAGLLAPGHYLRDRTEGDRRYRVGNDAAFGPKLVQRCLMSRFVRKAKGPVKDKVAFDFDLYNPKILDAVQQAAFTFCRETIATATDDLAKSMARLRQSLAEGLAAGEANRALAGRIQQIFADPFRAHRIAATEASRAVHAGQLLAAAESGVVVAKVWLASPDACELCQELEGKTVPLNQPFYFDPKGGPYAAVMYPPLHPFCMCAMTEMI